MSSSSGGLVDHRIGPDAKRVKAPRDRQLRRAIDAIVSKGHPAGLDMRLAGLTRFTLPKRRIRGRGYHYGGLQVSAHDETIVGIRQTECIVGLSVLPGIVLAFDAYEAFDT